jgi:hypothetical protein
MDRERDEPRSRRNTGGTGSRRNKGMSAETIIDIVQRLGVVDLVVDRLRSRLEDLDTDELMDDVTEYLKRNPEVLVVAWAVRSVAVWHIAHSLPPAATVPSGSVPCAAAVNGDAVCVLSVPAPAWTAAVSWQVAQSADLLQFVVSAWHTPQRAPAGSAPCVAARSVP